MKWRTKIPGGALQFVLFMGVAIAILLLAFISLSHVHRLFAKKTTFHVNALKSADTGMALLLKRDTSTSDTLRMQLPEANNIILKGKKDLWGIYERYSVTTKAKKKTFSKTGLVGRNIPTDRPALYLADHNSPLIVVGKAKLNGDVFIPKRGIRAGNIGGNSYYNRHLFYGRERQSAEQLPLIHPVVQASLQKLLQAQFVGASRIDYTFYHHKPLHQSFFENTLVLEGDFIALEGVELIGNIVVRATEKIVVFPNSNLKDILLIAPEIELKNGVHGTFQAIASQRISVGESCRISYPSALVVVQSKKNTEAPSTTFKPEIEVQKNTYFGGIIAYLSSQKEEGASQYPQILIAPNVQINGELYCEQTTELKGHVNGSVYTHYFMARENGNTYQNHLFNGTISSADLHHSYAGITLQDDNNKTVGKWLY